MINFSEIPHWVSDFFDKGLLQGSIVTFTAFVIGYFVSWIKRNGYFVRKIFNYYLFIERFLTRKRIILIWNDHDDKLSDYIGETLKKRTLGFKYKTMKSPDIILKYPLSPKIIHMIILIVSDVTKLSEKESRRDKIQDALLKYVIEGGTLFGTHDLIYRRCRNEKLQAAYGCEITNFKRFSQPIKVVINEAHKTHPLVKDLPQKFEVDDGELCWGHWGNDSEKLIKTESKVCNNHNKACNYIPILVIKELSHKGNLIWLNSADKRDRIADSLTRPQSAIIQIFVNAIEYADERK